MNRPVDVAILGAGIVGAACADALTAEGLTVTVVEPAIAGGGATAAGMGHIVVMDDSEAEFALTRYSRDLWDRLLPELPPEAEPERCGTLWVAVDEEEMAAVRAKAAFYNSRRVPTEILDARAVSEAEPHLRPGCGGALLVPGDCVIYAPFAAKWMLDRAQSRGAAMHAAEPVEIGERRVRLRDGSAIEAGHIVCAAGTWAASLIPNLGIRPRKGHLAITDRYPGLVRRQIVELGYLKSAHGSDNESVAFNVQPRKTGQLLIGSSRQFGAAGGGVDRSILGRMLQRAIEYMPALARLGVIRVWTGFRAATADKLPLIGPCTGRTGVYLATGHEGLGITTSLGTARLIADMILGRKPAIDAAPYLPARLASEPAHA